MKSIIKLNVFFLAVLCLLSCKKDDLSADQKADMRIKLSMRGVASEQSLGNDPGVNTIRVMVFDANGYIDVNKVFSPVDGSVFEVNTRVGKNKKVVVIANEKEQAMVEQLEHVLSMDQLAAIKQSEYTDTDKLSGNSNLNRMLIGMTENIDVNADQRNTCDVKLYRAYSKVSVNVTIGEINKNDRVVIKSVKLINMAKDSYLKQKDNDKTLATYDITKNITDGSPLELSKPKSLLKDYYLYEQVGNKAEGDKIPTLEVTAIYNGIEARYTRPVSFNEDIVGGSSQLSTEILRNHSYEINATINKIGEFDGMIVTTKVLPWNKETITQDITLPSISQISLDKEGLQPVNYTDYYKVSPYKPLELWVKINSDIPEDWKASLTNGLHFSVSPSSGKVNSEEPIKITITSSVYRLYDPIKFDLFFNVGKFSVAQSAEELSKRAEIHLTQLAR